MQLWLLGGGLLGATVGYLSQKKPKKEIGALVGAGVGALAGVAIKWQYDAYSAGRRALAPYAQEATSRVGAAASAAGSALTTPSYQQLPGKTAGGSTGTSTYSKGSTSTTTTATKTASSTSYPTTIKGSAGSSTSASDVEALLDDAGLPSDSDGEGIFGFLRGNPFENLMDSWTIE